MKQPKYAVELSEEERAQLESMLRRGKSSARRQARARILLKADEGMLNPDIQHALDVSETMVYRARQRFVEEGLEAALNDKPRAGRARSLDVAAAGRQGSGIGICGLVQP